MRFTNVNILSRVLVGAIAMLSMSVALGAEILLGVANYSAGGITPEKLVVIDRVTGVATLVGPLDTAMAAIGLSDHGGKLYTYSAHLDRLLEIDPTTGATLATIDIGASIFTEGSIAFRADGVGFAPDGSSLLSFEISPLSSNTLGYLAGVSNLQALDFDADDVLYGLSHSHQTNTNWLYTIDETTLAVTTVGDTGIIAPTHAGMTFMSDGTLLAALDGNLYNIDKTTGDATPIGSMGFGSVSGLTALSEEEPEPPDLAPVITANDVMAAATSPAGAIVNYIATAADNEDGVLTPTCSPPPGSTF